MSPTATESGGMQEMCRMETFWISVVAQNIIIWTTSTTESSPVAGICIRCKLTDVDGGPLTSMNRLIIFNSDGLFHVLGEMQRVAFSPTPIVGLCVCPCVSDYTSLVDHKKTVRDISSNFSPSRRPQKSIQWHIQRRCSSRTWPTFEG